jgi:hypothetical protein
MHGNGEHGLGEGAGGGAVAHLGVECVGGVDQRAKGRLNAFGPAGRFFIRVDRETRVAEQRDVVDDRVDAEHG